MWDTIVGGCIALAAALATQLIQWRRDASRWEREASRRFYDKRAEVYQDFLKKVRTYAEDTQAWEFSRHPYPPSNLDPDVLDPAYAQLFPIKIFGTPAAYKLGHETVDALWALMQRDGARFAEYESVEARLISRLRLDLDISDGDQVLNQATTDNP